MRATGRRIVASGSPYAMALLRGEARRSSFFPERQFPMPGLSPRLREIVDALPLKGGMRVLEIGCGPGAAAREVARRIGHGHVLAIDRSARAIAQARAASRAEIASGRMTLRQAAAEALELEPGEVPYDIAFAIRVGALDGRHPETEAAARRRIAAALTENGRLFIDGGDPLREISLAEAAAGSPAVKATSKAVNSAK
jgi:cyclopropane fatty-acyl-phospholipid synthase-like methyltransferase